MIDLTYSPYIWPPANREQPSYDYRTATGLSFQPPRDAMTQALSLMRDIGAHAPEAHALLQEGKQLWLRRDLADRSALVDYYKKLWSAEYGLAGKDSDPDEYENDPRDQSLARQFIHDYVRFKSSYPTAGRSSAPHWLKLNDNIYGRKFESDVARQLVQRPLPDMLIAARMMGQAFVRELDAKLYADPFLKKRNLFLAILQYRLSEDRRPWFGRTQYITALMKAPSIDLLKKALMDVNNGFDMIGVPYLIVKAGNSLQTIDLAPEYLEMSTLTYARNILGLRSTLGERDAMKRPTSSYGIGLPPHPRYESAGPLAEAPVNWTIVKPFLSQLRPFAKRALAAGYPVVCGLSGSTYILTFLMHYLRHQEPDFNGGAGMLAVLAFLSFDGGHAFNEAMPVYHASTRLPKGPLKHDESTWSAWRAVAGNYSFHYKQLSALPSSEASQKAIDAVLERALDSTLDYFKQHDVMQRANREAAAIARAGGKQLPPAHTLAFESDDDF
ncbi:hypothetical protein Busp01_06170 [Trinickia caryophylli]|nr:hypothetical protein Busp01_06170 [Trinickia caryophylli]